MSAPAARVVEELERRLAAAKARELLLEWALRQERCYPAECWVVVRRPRGGAIVSYTDEHGVPQGKGIDPENRAEVDLANKMMVAMQQTDKMLQFERACARARKGFRR